MTLCNASRKKKEDLLVTIIIISNKKVFTPIILFKKSRKLAVQADSHNKKKRNGFIFLLDLSAINLSNLRKNLFQRYFSKLCCKIMVF